MTQQNQQKYELRLYIAKETEKSERLINQLEEILESELENYDLKVINITEEQQLAEEEKILATPMLEKKLPLPVRRIIGDLADKQQVLVGLDLVSE